MSHVNNIIDFVEDNRLQKDQIRLPLALFLPAIIKPLGINSMCILEIKERHVDWLTLSCMRLSKASTAVYSLTLRTILTSTCTFLRYISSTSNDVVFDVFLRKRLLFIYVLVNVYICGIHTNTYYHVYIQCMYC